MAKGTKPWKNQTCERFVVYLDIMGFTDRVYRQKHEDVKSTMEDLFKIPIDIIKEESISKILITDPVNKGKKSKTIYHGYVRPVMFSDTVLLISKNNSETSFKHIIDAVQLIVTNSMISGIPIKGAMAYGKCTANFNESIYLGWPLIDALKLQEELVLYGVILHHTVETYLNQKSYMKKIKDKVIYDYSVPLKQGNVNHYLVDWMLLQDDDDVVLIKDSLESIRSSVSGFPRRYVFNTLEFINFLEKKKVLKNNSQINAN